jgi:hypothetical protein
MLLWQNTIDFVICKEEQFISHGSQGWKVQNKGFATGYGFLTASSQVEGKKGRESEREWSRKGVKFILLS